jgi:hypothetical protein
MIYALKASAFWLGNAVIYLAAFLSCMIVSAIIAGWNGETGSLLALALLLIGAVAWPVLDNWMADLVLAVTGSYRAMPALVMVFAIILGIGLATIGQAGWHGFALFSIGLIGVLSLHEWIVPPLALMGEDE